MKKKAGGRNGTEKQTRYAENWIGRAAGAASFYGSGKRCLKDTAAEVDELKESILWMKKQMFASKSEKRPEPEQQMGMFNEAEQEYKEQVEEPAKKEK